MACDDIRNNYIKCAKEKTWQKCRDKKTILDDCILEQHRKMRPIWRELKNDWLEKLNYEFNTLYEPQGLYDTAKNSGLFREDELDKTVVGRYLKEQQGGKKKRRTCKSYKRKSYKRKSYKRKSYKRK